MKAFDAAKSQPWLITPDWLRTILDITARENVVTPEVLDRIEGRREMLAARKSGKMDNTRYTTKSNGVAVIEVAGPIVRYADIFTEISGGTSTAHLSLDFQAALDDPSVSAIVLSINSPGGEATGIHELGQMIYAARGQKPIVAYAEGFAASAAYWLASAADEIVVDKTAMLGSIGVVFAVPDPTKSDSKDIEIVSTQSPKKHVDATTEAGKGEIQRLADEMAAVFVDTVARNRGVTAAEVLSDFGQGGMRIGSDAITHKMADRLGSLESIISELSNPTSNNPSGRPHVAAPKNRMEERMTTPNASPELTAQLEDERKKNATLLSQLADEKKLRESAEVEGRKIAATAQVEAWEREGKLSGNSAVAFRTLLVAASTGQQVTADMVASAVATLPKIDATRLAANAGGSTAAGGSTVTLEDFKISGHNAAAAHRITAVLDERQKSNPKFTRDDLYRELQSH